ncbi:hypothetical protein OfM1_21590 [Lactovum odontotermitis]
MAKIKLDKIIFTDKITDFYVDSKIKKVYMRPHTVFEREKDTGDMKFYTLGSVVLVFPIMRVLSSGFVKISFIQMLLISIVAFGLGLIFSYFIEEYTLRKQTLNKSFIEIKEMKILKIALKASKKSNGGWTTVTWLAGILAFLFASVSLMGHDSKTQTAFLFCSLFCFFLVGFVAYRAFRIGKSFRLLKIITGASDDE